MVQDSTVADFYRRALKDLGPKRLEEEVASLVSHLADDDYECEIKSLDFDSERNAFLHDATEVRLVIRKRFDHEKGFGVSKSVETEGSV